MDIPQLKLLAGLVRGLLEQHDVAVGHSQSLDLIAALPGLRNWPEVNAFPSRVVACELTASTAARLAHRLRSKHGVDYSPAKLVAALSPPDMQRNVATPQVWPSGPPPGVYLTCSPQAIDALLHRYDEATDGELVYAESAASGWEGAIDLGDWGLSSKGLQRVPSGTLLVVGPLELNQGSWQQSAEKLEWACLRAGLDGHRVAVLIDTPQPDLMFKDVELAVQQVSPEGANNHLDLTGVVTEDGNLQPRVPFVQPTHVPVVSTAGAPTDALPPKAIELLKQRLQKRSHGFLILGSCVWQEHWGIEQIAAVLPLTEALGPVARIKARNRSTPAKDMMVPEVVKEIPFLASVESAYAHGYRRMLVQPHYSTLDDISKYPDVLFLIGSHHLEIDEAFLEAARLQGFRGMDSVYERLVACIGVLPVVTTTGAFHVADMFVPGGKPLPVGDAFDVIPKFARKNRAIRWEDELAAQLDAGSVTVETIRAAASGKYKDGVRCIDAFLAKWAKRRGAAV